MALGEIIEGEEPFVEGTGDVSSEGNMEEVVGEAQVMLFSESSTTPLSVSKPGSWD